MIEEMARGDTPLDLVLASKEELVEDVKLRGSCFSLVPSESQMAMGTNHNTRNYI